MKDWKDITVSRERAPDTVYDWGMKGYELYARIPKPDHMVRLCFTKSEAWVQGKSPKEIADHNASFLERIHHSE